MLEQVIARADLPNRSEWHNVLGDLLLKTTQQLSPNVRNGDSMDVRRLIKIKKVPGGRPRDSEYIEGLVITKNLADKNMARTLSNPRIMIISFPIDFTRVDHQYVSLDPLVQQERGYLRKLANRIIELRPQIIICERSVSRLAIDHFVRAGIAVARSVKPAAIAAIARCTQADILGSMDRLAIEPRLGRCAEYKLQSFEHVLIPSRRKTIMRFEGCHKPIGCTLLLRGGDVATLRKVKDVVRFMTLVVYHLKNELVMYTEEHNLLPPEPPVPPEYVELLDTLEAVRVPTASAVKPTDDELSSSAQVQTNADETAKDLAAATTREIAASVKPYLTTLLSASAAIRFPPPAPLARMAELDRTLTHLRSARDDDEEAAILKDELKAEGLSLPYEVIIPTTMVTPETPMLEPPNPIDTATTPLLSATPTVAPSTVSSPSAPRKEAMRDPYKILRHPEEVARDTVIAQLEHDHAQQLEVWRSYLRRTHVDLRPEAYQGLLYAYSSALNDRDGREKPCVEPTLHHVSYYQRDDMTVGQFIEGFVNNGQQKCPNTNCLRPLSEHVQLLVHGDRRLQIAGEEYLNPSPAHEDQIVTWSYCPLCSTPEHTYATTPTIMRDETWKMSWGAYLEHCFYPPDVSSGFDCPHDAIRGTIRYFSYRNFAVRIHNDDIDVFDPVKPALLLHVRQETKVTVKNLEYETALAKNAAYFDSVFHRLRGLNADIVQPEKVGLKICNVPSLISRAPR